MGGITSKSISTKELDNKVEIQIDKRFYVSERKEGQGQFSVSYLLQNQNCIEQVILKRFNIPNNIDSTTENMLEALKLEYDTVKDVQSENVLRFFIAINNNSYILEYANQGTLAELIKNPQDYCKKYHIQLTSKFLFNIAIGIYKGLYDLKEQTGFKHSDLKPYNIFVSDSVTKILGIGYKNIFKKSLNRGAIKSKVAKEQKANYPTGENVYDAAIIICKILFPLEDNQNNINLGQKFYNKFKNSQPSLISRYYMKFLNPAQEKRINVSQAIEELTMLSTDPNIHLLIFESYKNKGTFEESKFIDLKYIIPQQPQVIQQNVNENSIRTSSIQPIPPNQSSSYAVSTSVLNQNRASAAATSISPYQDVYSTSRQSYTISQTRNEDTQNNRISSYQSETVPHPSGEVQVVNPNNNYVSPQKIIKRPPKQQTELVEYIYYTLIDQFTNNYQKIVTKISKIRIMDTTKIKFIQNDNSRLLKSVFDLNNNTILTPFKFKENIQKQRESQEESKVLDQISEKDTYDEQLDNMTDLNLSQQTSRISNEASRQAKEQCTCLEIQCSVEELLYGDSYIHGIPQIINEVMNKQFARQDQQSYQQSLQLLYCELINNPTCAIIVFALVYLLDKLELKEYKEFIEGTGNLEQDHLYLVTLIDKCIELKDKRILADAQALKAYLITKHQSLLSTELQKDIPKQSEQLIKEAETLNPNSSFVLLQKGNLCTELNKKVQIYEQAMVIYRNNYECLLQLHDAYSKQKNYQKAEFYLSIIPQKYSLLKAVIERKVNSLNARQQYDQLLNYLIQLPQYHNRDVDLIIYVSECLISMNNMDRLKEEMLAIIQGIDKNVHSIEMYCIFLLTINLDKSIQIFEKFKSQNIFSQRFIYLLCQILVSTKKNDKAKQFLEEVLNQKEKLDNIQNNENDQDEQEYKLRAFAMQFLGKKNEYRKYAIEKLKQYPLDIEFKNTYINFLYEEKLFDEIISIGSKLAIYPKDYPQEILKYLIFAYLKTGKGDIAVEVFSNYIDSVSIFIEPSQLQNFLIRLFYFFLGETENEKALFRELADSVMKNKNIKENLLFLFISFYTDQLIDENKLDTAVNILLACPMLKGGLYQVSEYVFVYKLFTQLIEQIDINNTIKIPTTQYNELIKKSYIIGSLLLEVSKNAYDDFFLDYQAIIQKIKQLKLTELNNHI